jgi:hypothetical protein
MKTSGHLQAPATFPPVHIGLVGYKVGLDVMVNREMPCPYWESNPDSSMVHLPTQLTRLVPGLRHYRFHFVTHQSHRLAIQCETPTAAGIFHG